MKYEKTEIVKGCYHECRLFKSDMDGMQCTHPYFEDKGPYENMIITQQNSRDGKIPEKCPLRNGDLEMCVQVRLKLEINQ